MTRPDAAPPPSATAGPPSPLADPAAVDAFGDDLREARFDAGTVPELLGTSAHRALGRGEVFAAERVTRGGAALETLVRLFLLGLDEPASAVAAALPRLGADRAVAEGVLERAGDRLRAALDVRPHADDVAEYLVVSDPDFELRPGPVRPDHVLGIGAASLSLARAVIRAEVDHALDIGTGCGIQSLHLSSHAGSIVATDTNPRALALAGATARLNGLDWDLRLGGLYEPVGTETFDLVVSNPPFVVGPGETRYTYRDSGMAGDEVCRALVTGAAQRLRPGGTAQFLANWVVRTGTDWRSRVGGWVQETGCDAWVVQRELADPAEYVALWGKDAGETGAAADAVAGRWLDWLQQQDVEAIGMGVITLRRSGADDPDVVLDELTGPGDEVTGEEAAAFLARRRWLRSVDDRGLLATRLSLAPDVLLEERSLPGPDGWTGVLRMLRRPTGPGATLQVDEWGRSLLAGCTGLAPLGLLVELLAGAHGLDPDAVAAAVLPSVRDGITRGLLHPVEHTDPAA
ncbi:DUF7782 domain-containing protein [Nakamurella endophytica]|uniref:Methyltransferase n=1 Tax=Nakamurella endophytica TaxID=1748367 RepID=A0A917T727_9ACTN|nr:class I SAM-dependent methyltransferase [Nakamurella endophytica]GGM11800.1 methyltransferase [Nakamurella endophytica]